MRQPTLRFGRSWVRSIVALAAVVLIATGLVAVPTSAQIGVNGPPALILAGQDAWGRAGAPYTLRLVGKNVPPGSTVALTVHDSVDTRTGFDESINGGALPATRDHVSVPYDVLQVDPTNGQRVLRVPTTDISQGGVYPLEVDLRGPSDQSLSRFVTDLVLTGVTADGRLEVGVPLEVAWVWPLATEPGYVGTGTNDVNPTALDDLQPGTGRLGRAAAEIATNTDVPLTLVPSPETLDSWESFAAGKYLQLAPGTIALRSAGASHEIVPGSYVPLDYPAVLKAGLVGVVNEELDRGITGLENFFGMHLDPSTALPGPLNSAALRVLENANVRQLIVHGNQLTPANEKFTPAHPYQLQAVAGDPTSAVKVVASDTGLEQFLSGNDPPALRAAHLLAGLALVAGEQPSLTRGVAIVNPVDWDANSAFVAAVLAGLRGNPLLQPTTVANLLATVPAATVNDDPNGQPVVRELAPITGSSTAPVNLEEYDDGVTSLNRVQTLLATAADPRVQRSQRALASSVSAIWETPAGRHKARHLLESIQKSVTSYTSLVKVQPPSTITITSSRANIPITFQNTSASQFVVHVKLRSDRLLFPDGAERDVNLPPKRSTTIRFAVETRSSGSSPLLMTVTTAGGLSIGNPNGTQIKVRSTFVSGVGLFLTIGAIVFLALWWGWDIRRRRKGRARRRHPTGRMGGPVATSGHPA